MPVAFKMKKYTAEELRDVFNVCEGRGAKVIEHYLALFGVQYGKGITLPDLFSSFGDTDADGSSYDFGPDHEQLDSWKDFRDYFTHAFNYLAVKRKWGRTKNYWKDFVEDDFEVENDFEQTYLWLEEDFVEDDYRDTNVSYETQMNDIVWQMLMDMQEGVAEPVITSAMFYDDDTDEHRELIEQPQQPQQEDSDDLFS